MDRNFLIFRASPRLFGLQIIRISRRRSEVPARVFGVPPFPMSVRGYFRAFSCIRRIPYTELYPESANKRARRMYASDANSANFSRRAVSPWIPRNSFFALFTNSAPEEFDRLRFRSHGGDLADGCFCLWNAPLGAFRFVVLLWGGRDGIPPDR